MKKKTEKSNNTDGIHADTAARNKRCMEKYSSGMFESEICRSENISRRELNNIFNKAGPFRRIAFEQRRENEFKNHFQKALLMAQEVNRIPYSRELKEMEIPIGFIKEIKEELKKMGFGTVNYQTGQKINDEALLNELKRISNVVKKTPGIKEITQFGKYVATVYYAHFGSLAQAQHLAGLAPTRRGAPGRRNKRE